MNESDYAWLEWLHSRHKFECIVTLWEIKLDNKIDWLVINHDLVLERAYTPSEAVQMADCGAMFQPGDFDSAEILILMRKARKPVATRKK